MSVASAQRYLILSIFVAPPLLTNKKFLAKSHHAEISSNIVKYLRLPDVGIRCISGQSECPVIIWTQQWHLTDSVAASTEQLLLKLALYSILPVRLLDSGSTEVNHAVDGKDDNDVELFDAVSKVACVRTMAARCTHQLALLYGSPACLAARTGSVPFDNADRPTGWPTATIANFSAPSYASLRAIPARLAAICHRFPEQHTNTSSSNAGLRASGSPESVDVGLPLQGDRRRFATPAANILLRRIDL